MLKKVQVICICLLIKRIIGQSFYPVSLKGLQFVSKRPINLNLLTIRFPITAIASILHRLSGFFLFLMIPAFLAVLALSLRGPEAFFTVHTCFQHPLIKLILLGFLLALFYHLLAGIRHLLMDAGVAEELKPARLSAGLVIALAILATGLMGIYLW